MQPKPIYTNDQNNPYPVINSLPPGDDLGPIHKIPNDVFSVIFAHAGEQSLGSLMSCKSVNTQWKKILFNDCALRSKVENKIAFGPEDWAQHMGMRISNEDIQAAYAMLPDNMEQILNSPCPVSTEEGKLVKDTHMLVYILSSISEKDKDGNVITKDITLRSLGELVEDRLSKEGKSRDVEGYGFILDKALEQLDKSVGEGHWVLMTKDVLGGMDTVKGSRNKPFTVQQDMLKELSKDCGADYVAPKTLEAVAAIIAQFLRTREFLFGRGEQLWTYTRCEEKIGNYQMVVGAFAPVGLNVCGRYYGCDIIGVAGLRKFSR